MNQRFPYRRKKQAIVLIIVMLGNLIYSAGAPCLTISEEKELGREFLKQARQNYRIIQDPFIQHYINTLGEKLVQAFPDPLFEYRFFVIQENTYNAFAAPGGYVFINSGLIGAMETEKELAGILTHEIAHVNCRHISERIEKSKKVSLATLAGLAVSVLLGGVTGIPGNAVAIGSAASGQAAMLAYSREDERQADQLGLKYLCQAGYHPEGLVTVLKKIKAKAWIDAGDFPTYLSTHPGVNERIAYLDTLMRTNRFAACDQAANTEENDFAVMHTKIIAEYSDETLATQKFQVRLRENAEDTLAHYGYGLVLARKSHYIEAVQHFQAALRENAFNPHILKDLGQTYFLAGQYEKALGILKNIPEENFYDPIQQFYLARTMGELGQPEKSAALLKELINEKPEFSLAFYHLGKTYGKQKQMTEAHYYLGLYYQKIGEGKNARFHLEKALKRSVDPEKKKEIETILDTLKKEASNPYRADNTPVFPASHVLTGRVVHP